MAEAANTAGPERKLALYQALEERLASKGLTLAGVVDDALNPHRRLGRMPAEKLAKGTWRAWAAYLLSRREELPAKDERHLRTCQQQKAYLSRWQMNWIFDIVARIEPAACGTWGAPN
jgi:hypothetical protein